MAPFHSLLGALGPWKNSCKCVTIIKFRGVAPSRRSLFAGLARGCVLMRSVSRFVRFCAILRLPFWHILAPAFVKKEAWTNDAKSVQKWVRRFYKPNHPRSCGPLKNRRKPDNQTTRQWIEHALACLAARWRIYIYIYIYTYTMRPPGSRLQRFWLAFVMKPGS